MEALVFIDLRAGARLAKLGLTPEILAQAVAAGQSAADTCTDNDPKMLPGILAWALTTRSLREQVVPLGWARNDAGNQPFTLSPNGNVAIIAFSGDESTGRVEDWVQPQPRSPKGTMTKLAIAENERQIPLFPFHARGVSTPGKKLVWVLLFHRADTEVRSELSLPRSRNKNDRTIEWAERVILPSIPLDDEPAFSISEEGPPVVIEVLPKSR